MERTSQPHSELKPRPLSRWAQLGDVALWPIMYLACGGRATGFRTGDIQNTHPWHCQRVDATVLDADQLLRVMAPTTKSMRRIRPFFHLPLLGGWHQYVVVQADAPRYHIGWAIPTVDGERYRMAQLNRLPLDGPVKMLRAGDAPWVDLFAVDEPGRQRPLKCIGEGRLGDGAYPEYPLF